MENNNLEQRHLSESAFHDHKYTAEGTSPKHYSYGPTYKIFKKMVASLGDVRGKKILEYGCGSGWMTAELANLGAEIYTFDISKAAVEGTRNLLQAKGLSKNVHVQQMAAEELVYDDSSFDIVFGFAILHHLDLDKAICELSRVMKPGGIAVFAEPLESNPAIRIYRKLTPQYRTVDEKPINLREFQSKLADFSGFSYEAVYLTALLPFVFIYIPGLSFAYSPLLKVMMALDRGIFSTFPFVRKYAWYSIMRMAK